MCLRHGLHLQHRAQHRQALHPPPVPAHLPQRGPARHLPVGRGRPRRVDGRPAGRAEPRVHAAGPARAGRPGVVPGHAVHLGRHLGRQPRDRLCHLRAPAPVDLGPPDPAPPESRPLWRLWAWFGVRSMSSTLPPPPFFFLFLSPPTWLVVSSQELTFSSPSP